MYSKILARSLLLIFLFFSGSCTNIVPKGKITEDAFSKTPDDIFVEKNETVIALMTPLTGPSKNIGKALLDAAQLAVIENKNPNIALEVIDTAAPIFNVQDSIEDLTKKEVKLILGPLFYGESREIGVAAKRANITMLSFSNNIELTSQKILVFGITAKAQAKRIVGYAATKENIKEFYGLLPQNKFGVIVDAALQEYITKLSGEGTFKAYFYSNEQEMEDGLKKILEEDKLKQGTNKAIIFPEGGEKLAKFAELFEKFGAETLEFKLFGFDSWDNEAASKLRGINNGMFIMPRAKGFEYFKEKFEKYFGYKPPYVAILAYEGVSLAAYLNSADKGYSFHSIVNNHNYQAINMNYQFEPDGMVSYKLPIGKIIKGASLIIDEE